jgi:hypothetical protein
MRTVKSMRSEEFDIEAKIRSAASSAVSGRNGNRRCRVQAIPDRKEDMDMAETSIGEHGALLGARIKAAQEKLRARQRGASPGDVLGALNDELDELTHEDHDDAQQRLNKIEARLRAEEIRIEDEEEDKDR